MEKTKLLPIDYCSIERASELLTDATSKIIKVEDIEHWILKRKIIPYIDILQVHSTNQLKITRPLVRVNLLMTYTPNFSFDDKKSQLDIITSYSKYSQVIYLSNQQTRMDIINHKMYDDSAIIAGIWEILDYEFVLDILFSKPNIKQQDIRLTMIPRHDLKDNEKISIIVDLEDQIIKRENLIILHEDLLRLESHINNHKKLSTIGSDRPDPTLEFTTRKPSVSTKQSDLIVWLIQSHPDLGEEVLKHPFKAWDIISTQLGNDKIDYDPTLTKESVGNWIEKSNFIEK